MDPNTLLDQLKDIHPPAEISWWPPAPGWWVLAILVLGALAFSIYRLGKWRKQTAWRRAALNHLDTLRLNESRLDNARMIVEVNSLLKRCLASRFAADNFLSQTGSEWSETLNAHAQSKTLNASDISTLCEDAYQRTPQALPSDTFKRIERWIKGL